MLRIVTLWVGMGCISLGAELAAQGGAPRVSRATSVSVTPPGSEAVLKYFERLTRSDGGYGWDDQPDSHLTATYAAIGAHALLGAAVPRKSGVAEFVLTHHPIRGVAAEAGNYDEYLRSFAYQQIQSLLWLGEDPAPLADEVRGWVKPSVYKNERERHGNPVLQQEMLSLVARRLLGLSADSLHPGMLAYIDARRRADGSFNNTPAADGSGGHVLNTWWALAALQAIGRPLPDRARLAAWIDGAQLPSGGFTYAPGATIGALDDVAYTWGAVRALEVLGASPGRRESAIRYVLSLRNGDGGFGDRPGLPSHPMATFQALDALRALGALDRLGEPIAGRPQSETPALSPGLKVFTIQIEAPGKGSPREAAQLARDLGIHLWGAKNADPAWVRRAQAEADELSAPVTFFVSDEEYGTEISLPGLGTYDHVTDLFAPAGVDFGKPIPPRRAMTWPEFRRQRLEPLARAGGRIILQVNDNEEFTRVLLDDSFQQAPGYAAISTFHFGADNFLLRMPFLLRYRHTLPFVALQDAHEEGWWWSDDLVGYRTLFLAEEPTWGGWLEALERNWVVAVRHDTVTGYRTRMLGGAPGVQEFVRSREAEWKWWGERSEDIRRPLASVVAVTPDDLLEAGRPESGVNIRVRTWWHITPTQPVVELTGLSVDGRPVSAKFQEVRPKTGPATDRYYQYHLPDPTPGVHVVVATLRRLDTGETSTREMRFTVP